MIRPTLLLLLAGLIVAPPAAAQIGPGETWPGATLLAAALMRDWQAVSARDPSSNPYLVVVDVSRQTLFLLRDGKRLATWPVSTGYRGISERNGSDGTPLGLFDITAKLGTGLPEFAELDRFGASGAAAGAVFEPDDRAASDAIVARILMLEGLQPGFNAGGDVDTLARHIYIHGTANLGMIGHPASDGCVQMAPGAVIALYRTVPQGTPVLITPDVTAEPAIPGPAPSGTQIAGGAQTAGG